MQTAVSSCRAQALFYFMLRLFFCFFLIAAFPGFPYFSMGLFISMGAFRNSMGAFRNSMGAFRNFMGAFCNSMGVFCNSMGAFCNSMGAFCAAYGHALVPGACGGVVVPGRAAVSVDLVCKKDEKRIVFALLTFFTPPSCEMPASMPIFARRLWLLLLVSAIGTLRRLPHNCRHTYVLS